MTHPNDQGGQVYDIATRAATVEATTGVVMHDAETADLLPAIDGGPADAPDNDRPTVYATISWRRDEPRPPVIPAWLRNSRQRREVMRWAAGRAGYLTAYQTRQTLLRYSWAVPWYATRGALRITWRAGVWAAGVGNGLQGLRQEAATRNDPATWQQLEHHRMRLAAWRLTLLAACLLVALLGTLALLWWTPWWIPWLVAALALPVLARVGRPADRPILVRTVATARFTRLTAEMVRNAVAVLGIPRVNDPGQVDFPAPGVHRDGPGWLARFNLPPGVEAVKVMEKREALSSALRLPVDQVWPSAGPEHAGQVDLWVGYEPASKMRPPRWALSAPTARTSFFEPFPFGVDQRLRPVATRLFELNFLIGGQPGSGKTYGARALAMGAALDPIVELMIAEFKGTADFGDLTPLCSTYVCGVDDAAFDEAAAMVAWGLAESERRGRRIRAAKERGHAPQGKITPELAARPGSGLHPIVMVFDEVHEMFLARPEVAKDMERLIRRGRALGITIVLATQIPDRDSVPPNITRCVAVRWCMSVLDHTANDMILGTGAYKRGLSGTVYRPGHDAGWGVMVGLEVPGPVRGFFPTDTDRKAIVDRATRLRGGVVGDGTTGVQRHDLVDDVVRVFADTSRPRLQWEELAELLAVREPEAYAGITAEAVSSHLRGQGVASVDVKKPGERTARKGCDRRAVLAAVERRAIGSRPR